MKGFKLMVSVLILCSMNVFSQEKNIKHTIVKGETISSIAQLYKVSAKEIYKLNPKGKKTLQLNQVLLIPSEGVKKSDEVVPDQEKKTVELNHEVHTKETLYGIAKQYKTTVDAINKANPLLETEGLKIGQTIIIPATGLSKKEIANLSKKSAVETTTTATSSSLTHEVKSGESMYVIAKQYGVTLRELNKANPKVTNGKLRLGQMIEIPSNGELKSEPIVAIEKENEKAVVSEKELKKEETKTEVVQGNKKPVAVVNEIVNVEKELEVTALSEIVHEVLPKETKYGIAKQYGITVKELENRNPSIVQNLPVGSKLIIRASNSSVENVVTVVDTIENDNDNESVAVAKMSDENMNLADQLIRTASENVGTRYRSGGTTKGGFDCSGLMCNTFGAFDIKLPRSSIEQSSFGTKINTEHAQKGDLIFFKTNGRSRINHVGMVVEVIDGEIKFIHSSVHSGVIISSTKEKYYERNFAQVNRVLE